MSGCMKDVGKDRQVRSCEGIALLWSRDHVSLAVTKVLVFLSPKKFSTLRRPARSATRLPERQPHNDTWEIERKKERKKTK